MHQKDLVFLNDYIQFGYFNHIAGALALYNAGKQAIDIAKEVHERTELLSYQEATKQAPQLNSDVRVQTVMIARIYAEYVSTIEDFGALLYAIQKRKKKSIVELYLESQGEVAEFFDYVIEHPKNNLGQLLNLPTIEELKKRLPPEQMPDLEHHYEDFAKAILDIASMYRKHSDVEILLTSKHHLSDEWHDYVWIALELINNNDSDLKKSKPLMTKTFNKIKHRFMVIE